MSLPGVSVATSSVADVLLECAAEGVTGCLAVSDPSGQQARIWLWHGDVDEIEVPGLRPMLGVRLMSTGVLTPEVLALALEEQRSRGQGARLDEVLVDLGVVAADVVDAFLLEQQADMLAELLSWQLVAVSFLDQVEDPDSRPGAPVPVADLIARARDRAAEPSDDVAALGGPDVVPMLATSPAGAGDVVLGPSDWALLCKIDGHRTLRELAADCGFTVAEAASVLSVLHAAGLVDCGPDDAGFRFAPSAHDPWTQGLADVTAALGAVLARSTSGLATPDIPPRVSGSPQGADRRRPLDEVDLASDRTDAATAQLEQPDDGDVAPVPVPGIHAVPRPVPRGATGIVPPRVARGAGPDARSGEPAALSCPPNGHGASGVGTPAAPRAVRHNDEVPLAAVVTLHPSRPDTGCQTASPEPPAPPAAPARESDAMPAASTEAEGRADVRLAPERGPGSPRQSVATLAAPVTEPEFAVPQGPVSRVDAVPAPDAEPRDDCVGVADVEPPVAVGVADVEPPAPGPIEGVADAVVEPPAAGPIEGVADAVPGTGGSPGTPAPVGVDAPSAHEPDANLADDSAAWDPAPASSRWDPPGSPTSLLIPSDEPDPTTQPDRGGDPDAHGTPALRLSFLPSGAGWETAPAPPTGPNGMPAAGRAAPSDDVAHAGPSAGVRPTATASEALAAAMDAALAASQGDTLPDADPDVSRLEPRPAPGQADAPAAVPATPVVAAPVAAPPAGPFAAPVPSPAPPMPAPTPAARTGGWDPSRAAQSVVEAPPSAAPLEPADTAALMRELSSLSMLDPEPEELRPRQPSRPAADRDSRKKRRGLFGR